MPTKWKFWCGLGLQLALASAAFGQGMVPVRIPDPAGSTCIDVSKHRVYVNLRRYITNRDSSWFTEDKRLGMLVNTTVTGTVGDNEEQGPATSFPSVAGAKVTDFKPGQVSVAIEFSVIKGLRLTQGKNKYTGFSISVSEIKKKGRNTFGTILDLAAKALEKLPIPPNPYTSVADQFLKFANGVIDAEISSTDTTKEETASLLLAFKQASGSTCTGDFEKTGAIAIVSSKGLPGNSVPVTNTADYCFKAQTTPTFEILAGKKVGGACPAENTYRAITNNYAMFIVNAEEVGAPPLKSRLHSEALARCRYFGLSPAQCFGK